MDMAIIKSKKEEKKPAKTAEVVKKMPESSKKIENSTKTTPNLH